MNKSLRLYLTIILVSAAAAAAVSQDLVSPAAKRMMTAVQSLDVEKGLPQGYVNGIVQDSTGFIWLSTRDGLARYDGFQVKTFHYDPRDSASIASDVIQTIYLDREDRIWILYENTDVDIFDPLTEGIRHIRPQGPLGWLLEGREYQRPFFLQQDSRGKYWVVSSDLKQLRYFTMQHPEPVDLPLPGGEGVVALREGRDGEMYVCTTHSFYKAEGNRLHKISDLPHRRPRMNDRIGQMVQDKTDSWVIINSGYLEILAPGGDWQTVDLPDPARRSPFYFIDRSPTGDLYVTSANRVFRLNADHSLSLVWINPDEPGDIPAMIIDRSNVLWLGTNTFGARMIHLTSGGFHSYAYERGFALDVLSRYFHFSSAEKYAGAMDSYALRYASDQKGRLWMLGTSFGTSSTAQALTQLLRLTGGEDASTILQADSLHWLQFTFDHRNDCWAVILDSQQDTLLVKTGLVAGTAVPEASWRPAFNKIGYLAAVQDKLCIVYKKGIELYDPASGNSVYYTSEEVFGNVQLLMAVPDPRGPAVLWITSLGYGLIRFDTRDGSVQAFTIRDGIPSNSVYAAVPDAEGRLWCSSNKGIFRFDPVSRQVLSFVASDGLQGNEFNRYHFLRSPDGHIFFGGTRGWTAFHSDSIYVDAYQPETAITDILINNAPLSETGRWKDSVVTALQGLSLAHDQNFITFTFSGLQYSNPPKLQYRYKLEEFDKDWIEVGNRHIAGYTNLPPGAYVFKVNSSNEAGAWSSHIKTLPLIIRPPWWKTWWAYVLYVSIITGCAYVYNRYRAVSILVRQQMRRQQEEARQLKIMDEMKTRFFSNITHEFRTPLSLIIAPLEQISGEAETPLSVRKRINSIQNNAHQLLRLINQLLDMSKVEAGNMKVSLSRGDLGRFITDQVNRFEVQAHLKNIRLDISNDLPGEYDFDVDKWQKILFNLLSNAIKFTPPKGSVYVCLSSRYDDGVSHAVALEVKDSGIGIPEDELPFIFNRFYQVDDSGTRTHGGTGIGLALVKELAELMNGIVDVESKHGKGALFRITIPVAKATRKNAAIPLEPITAGLDNLDAWSAAPEALLGDQAGAGLWSPADEQARVGSEAPAGAGSEAPAGEGTAPLILLAEDNEELNSFMADTLGKDYRVITAGNGREALRIAKEKLPDLVISDIMMPEMDGNALCEELKGSVATDHVAFILLSAKASHESVVKGLRNHADDYITKPFHIDELQLRVHNLIDRQRKLRDHYHRQLTAPDEQLSTETITSAFLKRLYVVVEEHLDDQRLDVGMLAEKMAVSRRTLNRKLSMLVNLSASEVLKQYRLKRAGQLLQSGLNVSETAYSVGFTSVSYFSNSFKEFHGVVPSEYGSL